MSQLSTGGRHVSRMEGLWVNSRAFRCFGPGGIRPVCLLREALKAHVRKTEVRTVCRKPGNVAVPLKATGGWLQMEPFQTDLHAEEFTLTPISSLSRGACSCFMFYGCLASRRGVTSGVGGGMWGLWRRCSSSPRQLMPLTPKTQTSPNIRLLE